MLRLIHFSDTHIDMANRGRHDPETGLPVRVLDFLKALDQIVDAAVTEKVDLVLFAGDAYKDRTPAPTFQREWEKRIYRLSQAGIPTVLLVGNHDISPASGRAHTLQEFETLQVPNVHVVSQLRLLRPEQIGTRAQIVALPWVSRSAFMGNMELSANPEEVYQKLENAVVRAVEGLLDHTDPNLPRIFLAHASVEGAIYGGERTVSLGSELVLPPSLVKDPRWDYVALGHIHKAQNLNTPNTPPVIYSGSIERVDFSEARDEKYYMLVTIPQNDAAMVKWCPINGRKFIDRLVQIQSIEQLPPQPALPAWDNPGLMQPESPAAGMPAPGQILAYLIDQLPPRDELSGAIIRLTIEYPRQWDALIDESGLRKHCEEALEFKLVRRPHVPSRLRLGADETITTLHPLELLDKYWDSLHTRPDQIADIRPLAEQIIQKVSGSDGVALPPVQNNESGLAEGS